ncbi:hypothetical protein DSLASN_45550 [Desulfoluna limicola]|uniref:CDI immunity protein domain-containing protein n=1 Tax=Desulfoluna limicola TaxID=2810562 RepID=A0ABN6FCV9_9BACT|nr:hypothetical protein [Desulfoluna limicola]BCS98923.1 hypothetical protein DSLASN_45550 [Desulfoluna limicola]
MDPHEMFKQILSLTLFSDDELVDFALSRTGFSDNVGLGIAYPDPDDPEEDAIPPYSVRATYWDNGEQEIIVDEWEYLEALVRYFLDKNDIEKATQVNDIVLTLRGLPPQHMG